MKTRSDSYKQMGQEELAGFAQCQALACSAAEEVGKLLQEGWTERKTAELLNTYLQDCGVKSFFHKAFVWFGGRTRFNGIKNYSDFSPSHRVLQPGEVYILDVAPIYHGYISDIGHSACLGEGLDYTKAKQFLEQLRLELPEMFLHSSNAAKLCAAVERRIRTEGYEPVHHQYPFSVLGHRVHQRVSEIGQAGLLNFGWQSYWELLSRGLFSQLLNARYKGSLCGVWAIEPHIGTLGFGIKFEEILVVEKDRAYWLKDQA